LKIDQELQKKIKKLARELNIDGLLPKINCKFVLALDFCANKKAGVAEWDGAFRSVSPQSDLSPLSPQRYRLETYATLSVPFSGPETGSLYLTCPCSSVLKKEIAPPATPELLTSCFVKVEH
jgi:hypothetical protein